MLKVQDLGLREYRDTFEMMQNFAQNRQTDTKDQIWLLEHYPVYTQGLNGQAEHITGELGDIPLIHTDRGGQITYHGPGQLIAYLLIDLKRRKLGVRQLVSLLEQATIGLLADYGIEAQARKEAPGIYVKGKKIASLGLKIKRQSSYHGLALNVDMDLTPFQRITPCGLNGMQMTQIREWSPSPDLAQIKAGLVAHLKQQLSNWPIIADH